MFESKYKPESISLYDGMIMGMEQMGAKFVKFDGIDIFFEIPEKSEINDIKKLRRARDAWMKTFCITLKVRYTK